MGVTLSGVTRAWMNSEGTGDAARATPCGGVIATVGFYRTLWLIKAHMRAHQFSKNSKPKTAPIARCRSCHHRFSVSGHSQPSVHAAFRRHRSYARAGQMAHSQDRASTHTPPTRITVMPKESSQCCTVAGRFGVVNLAPSPATFPALPYAQRHEHRRI